LEAINSSNKNEESIILSIMFQGHRVILAGDAEGSNTDNVINKFKRIISNTSLLLASHHGSDTNESNNTNWVKSSCSKLVVFSAAKHTGFYHPRFAVGLCHLLENENLSTTETSHFISLAKCFTPIPDTLKCDVTDFHPDIWYPFKTKSGLYSTIDSGNILFEFNRGEDPQFKPC